MRIRTIASIALAVAPLAQLQAQDVVVMRRAIAAPRPSQPGPAAPAFRWAAGAWSTPAATQCAQSVTRTRTVRCLDAADAVKPDASCSGAGAKPAASESNIDYTACGDNYSCTPWVANQQASGGPHYLLYDGSAPADLNVRREMAKRLCEAQAPASNIQICTETVIANDNGSTVLRVFASRGKTVAQPTPARIDTYVSITESSTALCTQVKN